MGMWVSHNDDRFDPDAVPVRLVVLVMMLAGMMMARAIPQTWCARARRKMDRTRRHTARARPRGRLDPLRSTEQKNRLTEES
jgi:hypothetical protein